MFQPFALWRTHFFNMCVSQNCKEGIRQEHALLVQRECLSLLASQSLKYSHCAPVMLMPKLFKWKREDVSLPTTLQLSWSSPQRHTTTVEDICRKVLWHVSLPTTLQLSRSSPQRRTTTVVGDISSKYYYERCLLAYNISTQLKQSAKT